MTTTIGSLDLGTLNDLYSDSTQYFWFESDSSSAWGSGAHVTLYPESQFTDSTNTNYMKGQNIIMNTDGFSIRNGALPMMVLDNDSLDFNAVDTSAGTYTTMATFGSTGATIGQTSGSHIQISSSGLDVNLNSSTNIATFGTSGTVLGKTTEGKTTVADDGLEVYGYSNGTQQLLAQLKYAIGKGEAYQDEVAPYFILGTRDTSKTIGNWSFSGGYNSNACSYCSFAFGKNVIADAPFSVAFGESVSANSANSVAFGIGTEVNAVCSESHGVNTVADGQMQMVLGRWNKSDASNKYALIVGNGTINGRSNALAVDWSGHLFSNDAQIGSVIRLKGSSYSSPLGTSYKTLNLSTTAEINTGNAFTADSNGIKCAYAGTVHLIGKVRFNDGFTANDYMMAQIYNTTQSTAVQTGRMRTPTQVFNGDVWVNAYARVNANDVILLRAENVSGARGTVTIGECSLTACYISV